MSLKLTCPTCTSMFGLPDAQRGKKGFCPKCAAAIIVTGAGVAKRGEGHAVDAPPRGFPWLLMALALVLTTAASVVGYFALRHREPPPHEQLVTKKADDPPPSEFKKEPDRGHEVPPPKKDPEPEPKAKVPAQEKKKDPELIAPVEVKARQPLRVKKTAAIPLKEDFVFGMTLSPDGKTLAMGVLRQNFPINLWDVASRKNTKTLVWNKTSISALAFSPDGKTLVSGEARFVGLGGEVIGADIFEWQVATGEKTNVFHTAGGVAAVAFSPDGNTVAAVLAAQEGVQLLDLRARKNTTLKTNGAAPGINASALLAFSEDGKSLTTTGGWNGKKNTLQRWELPSGKMTEVRAVDGTPLALSSDATTVATSGVGGVKTSIQLWDLASGQNLAELGHPQPVQHVSFSRDKKIVATCTQSPDSKLTIHLWEVSGWNTSAGNKGLSNRAHEPEAKQGNPPKEKAPPEKKEAAAVDWHMEYTPSHRATFEQQWTYTFPNHQSDRWFIALRYPPELAWSKDVEGKAELLTSKGWISFKEVREQSAEKRRMLVIDQPHNDPKLKSGFTVRTTLTATICDQHLKKGKPTASVKPRSAEERKAFTAATGTFDFDKPNVKKWMDQHKMWLGKKEKPIDFVHRVYKELRLKLPYDTKDGGPWICSQILKVGFGECCRHGIVGTSILRANKIPARTACALWAIDEKSTGGHCWGEFHLDGVGWVPYDTTFGGEDPKSDAYFANKKGEHIAGMIDFDWVIDAGPFGKQTVFAIDAWPAFWSQGQDNLDDGRNETTTSVRVLKRFR